MFRNCFISFIQAELELNMLKTNESDMMHGEFICDYVKWISNMQWFYFIIVILSSDALWFDFVIAILSGDALWFDFVIAILSNDLQRVNFVICWMIWLCDWHHNKPDHNVALLVLFCIVTSARAVTLWFDHLLFVVPIHFISFRLHYIEHSFNSNVRTVTLSWAYCERLDNQ